MVSLSLPPRLVNAFATVLPPEHRYRVVAFNLRDGFRREIKFSSDNREHCEIWAAAYLEHNTLRAVAILEEPK